MCLGWAGLWVMGGALLVWGGGVIGYVGICGRVWGGSGGY